MDIGWALMVFAMFLIGLSIIIFSKRFVNWVFSWSVPLNSKINKPFGIKNQNVEEQRKTGLWIVRIFGILICVMSLVALISGTITQLSE